MPKPRRNAHILVKLFVAFHLLAITVWSLPNPPQAVIDGIAKPVGTMNILYWNGQLKQTPIKYYLLSLGNWQYWDMFAPDPSSVDIWGDAEVEYKNGEKKRWQYPRIFLMPIPKKYWMERYRKFYERANDSQYPYLFPDFAQRVAYLNWDDPNNPPVKVRLYRHTMVLPGLGKPMPKEYGEYLYFEWDVNQPRLKEMKEAGWTAPSKLLGPP